MQYISSILSKLFKQRMVYLDTAAGTPTMPHIVKNMSRYLNQAFANPNTFHDAGFFAKKEFEQARKDIAGCLGARKSELFFTSGGTESNNLAILGTVYRAKKSGIQMPHVIVSAVEHPSVLETVNDLYCKKEIDFSIVPVDIHGSVDLKSLKSLLQKNTVLVSIMLVNNEIGTREPIQEVAKIVRHARKYVTFSEYPYLHTDAVQGYFEDIAPMRLGVDMLSLSAGKMYGVRGIGLLYKKTGISIDPILHGGGQESGMRSGTESVPLVLAFRDAMLYRTQIREKKIQEIVQLRDWFQGELVERFGGVVHAPRALRAAHILNITLPRFESELLVLFLASKGISVSAKSACSSESDEVSHVLAALYGDALPMKKEEGSIRFSLSLETKKSDLEYVLTVIQNYKTVQDKLKRQRI